MLGLVSVLHIHNFFVGFSSLILNPALFYALMAHYAVEWHQIRVFLALAAGVDTLFSTVELLAQTVIVVSAGSAVVLVTGPIGVLGQRASMLLAASYFNLVYASFLIIPSTFLFRYFVLTGANKRALKIWTIGICTGIILIALPSSACITDIFVLSNNTASLRQGEQDESIRELLDSYAFGGGRTTDSGTICLCTTLPIEFGIAYTTAVIFGIKITRFLRAQNIFLTLQTRRMQRRLTIALVLQAVVPIIFVAVPAMSYSLIFITKTYINRDVSILLGAFYNWIPLGNACISLAFYKPYRNFLLKQIFNIDLQNSSTSVDATSSSISRH